MAAPLCYAINTYPIVSLQAATRRATRSVTEGGEAIFRTVKGLRLR
jgi:hypothetical protein